MRIALASDLHLEHDGKNCAFHNNGNADVLILAGDVCDLSSFRFDPSGMIEPTRKVEEAHQWFNNVSKEFDRIVWVFGNHEYYDGDLVNAAKEYRSILDQIGVNNVSILENEVLSVGGIDILGCTLWSDFKNRDPQVMWDCQRGMSDYRYITVSGRRLTTEDIADKFDESVNFIRSKILESKVQTIIVTHHQPTWFNAVLEHGHGNINYAYYSELSDIILDNSDRIPYWFSGHTHTNRDDFMDNTRLVTNCRGYYGYETMAYNFSFKYFDL